VLAATGLSANSAWNRPIECSPNGSPGTVRVKSFERFDEAGLAQRHKWRPQQLNVLFVVRPELLSN
jgi:hypothetical protein